MELAILKYIDEHGLDKAVNDFALKVNDYGHKILLKYNQIESPFASEEVRDCRGLVLTKDFEIMSLPLRKFFNIQEGHAAEIDWDTARVYEKLDGTFIHVYYDEVIDEWCAATTGTADGSGMVNNKEGTTFADLFWRTLKNVYGRESDIFVPGNIYMFELCTPFNIVVTPHTTSSVNVLAIRNEKLQELTHDEIETWSNLTGVPMARTFAITDVEAIEATFEDMSYSEEGYVVCDANFNRVKIKNPAYVAAHHLKSKTAEHHIVEIIKTNEVDEYGATFPERKEELEALLQSYNLLLFNLENAWVELQDFKPKNITKEEKKKFAMNVFRIAKAYDLEKFTGFFFAANDGKIESMREGLRNMDNKKLYEIL